MKSHFFAYIFRMRFIQRWALMRNTAPENVQEHSHQVAVLAHALAVIRNEKFGGRLDPGAVAVAALYHDASEILTGDMPTPIKYYNPAIREAYDFFHDPTNKRLGQNFWTAICLVVTECLIDYKMGEVGVSARGDG